MYLLRRVVRKQRSLAQLGKDSQTVRADSDELANGASVSEITESKTELEGNDVPTHNRGVPSTTTGHRNTTAQLQGKENVRHSGNPADVIDELIRTLLANKISTGMRA